MIKSLVWTIILLSPVVLAGILSIFGAEPSESFFNAGAALQWTWDAIIEFYHLFSEEKRNILGFIWKAIVASFLIMPFIFIWRGLFFVDWIPVIGKALRPVILALIIVIPGVIANFSGPETEQMLTMLQGAILAFAMIGLWLPKKWTTRGK